jgi:hypothetical protein
LDLNITSCMFVAAVGYAARAPRLVEREGKTRAGHRGMRQGRKLAPCARPPLASTSRSTSASARPSRSSSRSHTGRGALRGGKIVTRAGWRVWGGGGVRLGGGTWGELCLQSAAASICWALSWRRHATSHAPRVRPALEACRSARNNAMAPTPDDGFSPPTAARSGFQATPPCDT